EKVLDIINKYQYRPNSIAQGLVTGSIKIISVIVPNIQNPFYSEVVSFIEHTLCEKGYHMFLYCSDNDPEKEYAALEMASQFNFAGTILISIVNDAQLIEKSNNAQRPLLLLNRYIETVSRDILTTDNFHISYIATRYLIELGHSRIAIIAGGKTTSTHRERRDGFLNALSTYHLQFPPEFDCISDLSMDSGYNIGETFLQMGADAPTAVFCTSDIMAIGLMQAYKNVGKSIPGDISIVGFDDIPIASLNGISLTTIRQPYKDIGRHAVDMILRRIEDSTLPQQKMILDCEFITRGSTGPKKM
ncbi:MAG: LacI family DNA-binding transcriptional regulator, partial [Oscillospiraceae bacterium]